MKKSIEVYALVVCFFALVWFTVTFGFFLNQLVRITFPQLNISASNYRNPVGQQYVVLHPSQIDQGKISSSQIAMPSQLGWEIKYKLALEQERSDALRNLVHDLITLIVSALLFIPHWKLARLEKLFP